MESRESGLKSLDHFSLMDTYNLHFGTYNHRNVYIITILYAAVNLLAL